jgi:hypothetical protein
MTVKDTSTLNLISKEYNLDFDKKFGYYVGDAYKDTKGEYIPHYMYCNGCVYTLKYFDGCFNPFLFKLDINNFGFILFKDSATIMRVVPAKNKSAIEHYDRMYGTRFSKF